MCFTGFDNWTLFNSSTCPPLPGWVSYSLIRIHPEYLLKFSNRAGLSNSLFFRSLIYCLVLGIFRKVLGGYRISGTIHWVAWFLVISMGELVNLDSNSATFGVESIRLCAHRLSWPTGGKGTRDVQPHPKNVWTEYWVNDPQWITWSSGRPAISRVRPFGHRLGKGSLLWFGQQHSIKPTEDLDGSTMTRKWRMAERVCDELWKLFLILYSFSLIVSIRSHTTRIQTGPEYVSIYVLQ